MGESDMDADESWESVIGTHHASRRNPVLTIIGYAMLLIGVACFVFVMVGIIKAALPGDRQAESVVDEWPGNDPKGLAMRRAADRYNAALKASGQPVIGESTGPDAERVGLSERSDEAYISTLDMGAGIIGKVVIPKIGVNLVIRHGSSTDVLNVGAGHVYGTSMPVGGKGTHAVIAAHRGGRDRMMFLRLDEMREGDVFYIQTLGHTLGYKVSDIRVVDPDEVSSLRVNGDEDEVTLLTCTPFNVNTKRLLVTGVRMPITPPAAPDRVKGDPTTIGIAASAIVFVVLMALMTVVRGAKQKIGPVRHMGDDMMPGGHGPRHAHPDSV